MLMCARAWQILISVLLHHARSAVRHALFFCILAQDGMPSLEAYGITARPILGVSWLWLSALRMCGACSVWIPFSLLFSCVLFLWLQLLLAYLFLSLAGFEAC